MLPRVSLSELSEAVESSHYFVPKIKVPAQPVSQFPAIPPKLTAQNITEPEEPDDVASWYIVLSPRESRGTAGPFSIPQLQRMYKSGEVHNNTLFWAEGEHEWQQLVYHRTLKPKLLQLPILPPKVGTYNAELAVYDPVIKGPADEMLDNAQELSGFDITKSCFKCGSMAVAHIPDAVSHARAPDLFKGRQEGGSTEHTSEILPGFLWVGSSAAAKQRAILRMGITLVINCTIDMKGPTSQPPAFRVRDAPMAELPAQHFTEAESNEMLDLFEKTYDWIEAHRVTPELAEKSDPAPKYYRGPTDKFGLPIKTAADLRVLRRPQDGEKPLYEPRVLLWSHSGNDRCCTLAAAYIIKHYHITVEHAIHIVKANRPSVALSSPHLHVLERWAARYTLGLLICIDCQNKIDNQGRDTQDSAFDAELKLREKALRRSEKLKNKSHFDEEEEDNDGESDEDIGFKNEGEDGENEHQQVHLEASLMDTSVLTDVEQKRQTHEDALENTYTTFVNLMKGHMNTMLKDRPHEYNIVSKVETYLHKVYTNSIGIRNRIQYFRWNGILDLELSGRHLSDLTMSVLFQLLAGNNLIQQIRMLKLQSNLIASSALKALLIAYFPEGHTEDDNYFFDESCSVAEVDNNFDLMLLDLSNNKIDEYGVPFLVFFLKQCNTLTSLDVSNNNLGDFLCSDVFQCLARPPIDFDDDGDEGVQYGMPSVAERLRPHNNSLTHLNIGFNTIGDNAVEMLTNTIKNNAVLRTLQLDLCPDITPLHYKTICTAIRLYNSVLEELSFADNQLTVKTVENISRILDSRDTHITKLNLSNCSMTHIHMVALAKYMLSAQHLTLIDLSGNNIGDKGATALVEMLEGKVSVLTNSVLPPLQNIDLSSCGLSKEGTATVLTALAKRTGTSDTPTNQHNASEYTTTATNTTSNNTLQRLDLSNNIFGDANPAAYAALAQCNIHDLRLNMCKLQSKGASILFTTLASKTTALSATLRYLYLSGNEISDSSAESLAQVLSVNITLQSMDLGFNLFTDRHRELLRCAGSVLSTSHAEKKVYDLSINLIGNKCDPYLLETPGMARAKSNFLFGTQPNRADPANAGYSHIPQASRGHFLARKELDNHHRTYLPLQPFNSIN